MPQESFQHQLNQRLDENKHLAQGGLPLLLQPLASWLGLYPWQSLVLITSISILGLVVFLGQDVVRLTEIILLIS